MIITRWQAPIVPNKQQVNLILESEGMEPYEQVLEPHKKVSDHRKPFAEVRVIISGEMIFNVAGNQFVLRPGDRVEIPGNTRFSYVAQGTEPCVSVCAQRAI